MSVIALESVRFPANSPMSFLLTDNEESLEQRQEIKPKLWEQVIYLLWMTPLGGGGEAAKHYLYS